MPTISGLALLSSDRTINSLDKLTPIPGLAITLYNIFTNQGASILTDSNGEFKFTNVVEGSYMLMETYGISNTFLSPFDFSKAIYMQLPNTSDPNISLITSKLPQGTNIIDSLTPNNIILTVGSIDLLNQNFIDGPVIYTPILILDDISIGPNLVTLANQGTFGLNPVGTYSNNSPTINPYPNLATSFGYQQYSNYSPNDGNISIANIQTLNTFNNEWWNLTNHSTGDEVGNFLIVNGDKIGQSIFKETISVSPSTYYTFFTWVANQVKILEKINPQFTIQVTGNLDNSSQVIFKETSSVIPTNTIVPEWKQLGTIFNSEKFETITVDIISDGGKAAGNDYAIDDISLQMVSIDTNIIEASKFAFNKSNPNSYHATIGDTLVYTILISNISPAYDLTSVKIVDTISNDLKYVENSLIGGTLLSKYNDNPIVISVETISKGTSTSVSFEVVINENANTSVIVNQAEVDGKILIDDNLLPTPISILTNQVSTNLDITIDQKSSHEYLRLCNLNTYTIVISNNSDNILSNVIFYDTLPCELIYVENSLYINSENYNMKYFNNSISLGTIPSNSKTIIEFKAKAICRGTNPTVNNQACITYTTLSINSKIYSNISTVTIISDCTNYAHLNLNKQSYPDIINGGETATYKINIYNEGNCCAENIVFNDILPSELNYKSGSLYINCTNIESYTIANNTLSLTLPDIHSNSCCNIEFDIFTSSIYNGNIVNTATVSYNFLDCCKYSNTLSSSDSSDIMVVSIPNNNNVSLDKSATLSSMKIYCTNTYTVTISNNSLDNLNNVIFYDDIGPELIYKSYSFTVDNKQYNICNLEKGVYIGTIPAKSSIVIKFKAKLVNIHISSTLRNRSFINYVTDSNLNKTTIYSNICMVNIIMNKFNQ